MRYILVIIVLLSNAICDELLKSYPCFLLLYFRKRGMENTEILLNVNSCEVIP